MLDDACKAAISSAGRHSGTALILLDVDLFKSVNDTHGHPVGDDALTHIASVLAEHSRADDVIARMGGDELAVLLPGCTHKFQDAPTRSPSDAPRSSLPRFVTRRWCSPAAEPAAVGQRRRAGAQVRELYASADAALYVAKHAGRGRVGEVPETAQPVPAQPMPAQPALAPSAGA